MPKVGPSLRSAPRWHPIPRTVGIILDYYRRERTVEMKQGRATHSGTASTKVEPKPKAITPGYANSLGMMYGNKATDVQGTLPFKPPVYSTGPGLRAPMEGKQVHHSGSQGKHK